jgi:ubiquinone/menaquinone biosynthesis C-methylase UbiE
MTNPAYVLGHSSFELQRLARQERLIGGITREYFHSAGIMPGMRVLDVGSGTGAVAFHAAELVGPSGEVIGTDLAPAAIAAASDNAAQRGFAQVSFRQGNPADMTFEQPFDAVVGRYVLLFQADPSDMLRRLARHLRQGGIMVFHEPDWSFSRSEPMAPLYDRCNRWVVETFDRVGTSTNMSAKLRRAFLGAGLTPPAMRMQAVIGDAVSAEEWLRAVAELTIVLSPTMEKQGVASLAEIEGDTLAERVIQDVAERGSMIVGRAEIGALGTGPTVTREAAGFTLVEFTTGKTFADYGKNAMLRAAVERKFEIIGEALAQLSKLDDSLVARITEYRRIFLHAATPPLSRSNNSRRGHKSAHGASAASIPICTRSRSPPAPRHAQRPSPCPSPAQCSSALIRSGPRLEGKVRNDGCGTPRARPPSTNLVDSPHKIT